MAAAKRPLIDTSEKRWFELLKEIEEPSVEEDELMKKNPVQQEHAWALYSQEVKLWNEERAKHETGDDRYMKQVLKSGTLSDKVAAMTLLVQESPVHRFDTLEALIRLAKSGKHASKMAIESLKELFGEGDLLPGDRRLRPFGSELVESSSNLLVLRIFESKLRQAYADVTSIIEGYTRHQAKELRAFAVETAAHLLSAKPEQEARLLSMVANKLGDPDSSVSFRATRSLCSVLDKHRAMTPVVCSEVQGLATRPNLDAHALYQTITFLSQVYLSAELDKVAQSLVEMYVALFCREVNKGALKTKLLSALLTGLNRALPYVGPAAYEKLAESPTQSKGTGASQEQKSAVDSLFLISHTSTFAAKVQALVLLERISALANRPDTNIRVRFYRALYAVAHSDDVRKSTRPTLFLNLCFKALKADTDPSRFAACLKRLIQVGTHSTAAVAAAMVYLASALQRRDSHARVLFDGRVGDGPDDWRAALKRDPLYAASKHSRLWELALLRHHYHPSVQKFAQAAFESPQVIAYPGDPLNDFTLSNFLDRFAYRNPKNSHISRHAKRPSSYVLDLETAPGFEFYKRYLEEAATFKAARAAANALKRHNVDDDRASEDSALSEDHFHDSDNDDTAHDDDDVEDDDAFDSDVDDDIDADEDDDDAAPTPITKAVVRRSEEKNMVNKRKRTFVDAEEYMDQLKQKQQKRTEKNKAERHKTPQRGGQITKKRKK